MGFDPVLADRLGQFIHTMPGMQLKKMFGGICWMLNGNMCVGVYNEFLIIRVGVEQAEEILDHEFVEPMDITGKPMKGWATVTPDGYETDENLEKYIMAAVSFVQTLPAK